MLTALAPAWLRPVVRAPPESQKRDRGGHTSQPFT
ncbi:hypothetical protein LTDYDHKI_CDS0025 [Exiguobacterium phage phiExGM16]